MSGFWDGLAEGSVTGLVKGVGSLVKDVRTAFTGKEPLSSEQQLQIIQKAQAIEDRMGELEAIASQGQIDLNKIDAQSKSLLKSGWRPMAGWVCVSGLAYDFLIRTLFPWVLKSLVIFVTAYKTSNIDLLSNIPDMPALDMQTLIGLLGALLGFGGYRMFERIRGKS